MSNKNSTGSDTESEHNFYSDCWEESLLHTNKDSLDSDSESDLYLHSNSQCSLFEKEGKSKLKKTLLVSEKSFRKYCKNCPILQHLENTTQFQVELSPESILQLNFKDCQTNGQSSKAYSPKILPDLDRSCTDHLCLNCRIPYVTVTKNSEKEQTFYTIKEAYAFDKLHQNHPPTDYYPTSKQNKAVQVSFPCKETEAGKNAACEFFKQSAIHSEVEETPNRKAIIFHSAESIFSKKTNSNELVKDNSDYSSEIPYKTHSPQTLEQIYLHTSSGELVISLVLEAAYRDPSGSSQGVGNSSNVRVGKEDTQRHALAFKFKGPECNQLFKKLCISIVPSSVHSDTEKEKHNTSFIKLVGLSQILVDESRLSLASHAESSEASQPLATHTEPSESRSFNSDSDQVLSSLELWSSSGFFPSLKHSHTTQSSHYFVQSLPCYKVTPVHRTSEVQKVQLKASRPVKSVVFTKSTKVQEDRKLRTKPHTSKFQWSKAFDTDPINQNPQAAEINKPFFVPLTQTTKCSCSPLLDLTVDLHSEGKYSETLRSVHRKYCKRTGGGKVTPRFSSCCLRNPNPRSHFENLQYISPVRKKSNSKMRNILNYCLGWTGGQKPCENCKGQVSPTLDSSNIKRNEICTPHPPTDGNSIASLLPGSRNSPVPLPTALSLSNEWRHSSAPCMQTERGTWSPALSYSDAKCSNSHSPCANIKIVQLPKEMNMLKNIDMEKMDFRAFQMAGRGLAPRKHSICPCGTMAQCGLFPNGDTSELVKEKARGSPNINQRANMTEFSRVNSHAGTFNTQEDYCASCHHFSPMCYFHDPQEVARNHFTKVQSYFENGCLRKNLRENVVERNKAQKRGERKNVSFHIGPSYSQVTGTQNASLSNYGYQAPVYHSECSGCTCCQNTVKEHLDLKHQVLKNCLNRESVFLVDPGKGTRSQCKCSQEIPLFSVDQTDTFRGNRCDFHENRI
ncbi:uncharacterized protein LOC117048865 [Lacerta agilis]|uniref:uncharacterized protein LOC117048865 n=1 Tax=Lacerta agilis TaxID=80427 RepID=UPI00141A3C72|nr:uncharacterized protein LOC117048865 [Lacerta agilis]